MSRRTTARDTMGFRHDWVRCRDGKYECDCLLKVSVRLGGPCPNKVQAALDDLTDAEVELAAKDEEIAGLWRSMESIADELAAALKVVEAGKWLAASWPDEGSILYFHEVALANGDESILAWREALAELDSTQGAHNAVAAAPRPIDPSQDVRGAGPAVTVYLGLNTVRVSRDSVRKVSGPTSEGKLLRKTPDGRYVSGVINAAIRRLEKQRDE